MNCKDNIERVFSHSYFLTLDDAKAVLKYAYFNMGEKITFEYLIIGHILI